MHNLLTDSFGGEPSRDGDIELGNVKTDAAEASLEGFFKWINEIEKLIEKLSEVLLGLEDANEEYKSNTNAASMKAIRQRMVKGVDEAKKIAALAKSKIEALDIDNVANLRKPGCGRGSGVERSRTATTLSIKKKFQQKLSEFQSLREKIQKDHRDLVERRVFTVTGTNADEETIDHLIETGQSEQIFQNAIREQGRGQVVDTVAEIQERHGMVKELERKLLDLQQIFLDMSVLVNTQGDMLDNIETHVSTAVDHVESGTSSLRKARKLQKNTRKWTCIALIILVIIVLVIVLSVVKPWKKK